MPETDKLNFFENELQPCSSMGTALTGQTRDGFCTENDETIGSHHICIKMWPNGVGKGPNFCEQTGQSDWCQERKPCHEDESQECGIQNWCISRGAWAKYVEKVGCDDAVDLHCDSVNQKALEAYESSPAEYHAALECLNSKCRSGASIRMNTKILLAT